MTAVVLEPLVDRTGRRLQGSYRSPLQAAGEIAAGARRFVILLLLGLMCAASSVAFVLSLCIAMPVLTEQFASGLKSGQWEPMPLVMILVKMGYVPSVDASLSSTIIDWLLSFETGFVIVAAASAFGGAVWIFEKARSAPTPRLRARDRAVKAQYANPPLTSTAVARNLGYGGTRLADDN